MKKYFAVTVFFMLAGCSAKYDSYVECVNEEVKAGGTESTARPYCHKLFTPSAVTGDMNAAEVVAVDATSVDANVAETTEVAPASVPRENRARKSTNNKIVIDDSPPVDLNAAEVVMDESY